jgi:hypothetical protein
MEARKYKKDFGNRAHGATDFVRKTARPMTEDDAFQFRYDLESEEGKKLVDKLLAAIVAHVSSAVSLEAAKRRPASVTPASDTPAS